MNLRFVAWERWLIAADKRGLRIVVVWNILRSFERSCCKQENINPMILPFLSSLLLRFVHLWSSSRKKLQSMKQTFYRQFMSNLPRTFCLLWCFVWFWRHDPVNRFGQRTSNVLFTGTVFFNFSETRNIVLIITLVIYGIFKLVLVEHYFHNKLYPEQLIIFCGIERHGLSTDVISWNHWFSI